jgi:hypothetical protein
VIFWVIVLCTLVGVIILVEPASSCRETMGHHNSSHNKNTAIKSCNLIYWNGFLYIVFLGSVCLQMYVIKLGVKQKLRGPYDDSTSNTVDPWANVSLFKVLLYLIFSFSDPKSVISILNYLHSQFSSVYSWNPQINLKLGFHSSFRCICCVCTFSNSVFIIIPC